MGVLCEIVEAGNARATAQSGNAAALFCMTTHRTGTTGPRKCSMVERVEGTHTHSTRCTSPLSLILLALACLGVGANELAYGWKGLRRAHATTRHLPPYLQLRLSGGGACEHSSSRKLSIEIRNSANRDVAYMQFEQRLEGGELQDVEATWVGTELSAPVENTEDLTFLASTIFHQDARLSSLWLAKPSGDTTGPLRASSAAPMGRLPLHAETVGELWEELSTASQAGMVLIVSGDAEVQRRAGEEDEVARGGVVGGAGGEVVECLGEAVGMGAKDGVDEVYACDEERGGRGGAGDVGAQDGGGYAREIGTCVRTEREGRQKKGSEEGEGMQRCGGKDGRQKEGEGEPMDPRVDDFQAVKVTILCRDNGSEESFIVRPVRVAIGGKEGQGRGERRRELSASSEGRVLKRDGGGWDGEMGDASAASQGVAVGDSAAVEDPATASATRSEKREELVLDAMWLRGKARFNVTSVADLCLYVSRGPSFCLLACPSRCDP
jgi:hypothetical protein